MSLLQAPRPIAEFYAAPVEVIEKKGLDEAFEDAVQIIASRIEPALRKRFIAAMEKISGAVNLTRLRAALKAKNIKAVLDALGIDRIAREIKAMADDLAKAYEAGGRTMEQFLRRGYLSQPAELRFNVANPRVMAAAKAERARLVTRTTADMRKAIAATMAEGLKAGDHPFRIARSLRDSIGLSAPQARALATFRRALVDRHARALARNLGPKLEAEVRRAWKAGTLDIAKVDELADKYRERLIKARAQVIARTEAIRALNAGQHESMRQAVDAKAVQESQLRRYWLVSRDEKTCPVCGAIPFLNRKGVGLDGSFKSDVGPLLNPPAHPNCRCSVIYRLETGNAYLYALNPAPKLVRTRQGWRHSTLRETPLPRRVARSRR